MGRSYRSVADEQPPTFLDPSRSLRKLPGHRGRRAAECRDHQNKKATTGVVAQSPQALGIRKRRHAPGPGPRCNRAPQATPAKLADGLGLEELAPIAAAIYAPN